MKILKKLSQILKSSFLGVCLGIIGLATVTEAIEIIPSTFVYQLSALGTTQDITFYNRKDKPERIKVTFKPFRTDSEN